MMKLSSQPKSGPVSRAATPFVRVSRITFRADAGPAGASRRQFAHPRRASAVEENVSIESVAAGGDRPEPTDRCFIVCIPEGSSSQSRERARALLALPAQSEARRAITLERGSDAVEWRPGLAVVQCREDSRNGILSALVDFTFYEGSLRALEKSVEAAEVQAEADLSRAHRIRYRDREHWGRLTDCAEECSRMRLTFARLEPQLAAAPRALPVPARSWFNRLLQKSDVESRLESLSDRLEALEDLYEGASQRVSEYRWYIFGHALEIGIIVLLLIECTLMSVDIYLHIHDRQASKEVGTSSVHSSAGAGGAEPA